MKFSVPQTCAEAYHSCHNDVEDTSCLKDEGRGADHQLPEINTFVNNHNGYARHYLDEEKYC